MAREGAPSRRRKTAAPQVDESRRFSTSTFKPPPLIVEIGGRDYEIAADIDIDVMEQMLAIEELVSSPDADDRAVLDALFSGRDLVRDLLEESNEDVPARIPLKAGELLGIFTFLMGGRTVGDEVMEALADGDVWGAERDGEKLTETASETDDEAELPAEAEAAPLATRSRRRSSASAKRGAGRSSGGKASPGASSDATSEKQAATG